MKDSKKFWDGAAKKYAKSPIKDEATYRKKLAITQEYLTPDSEVLEFGCGTGSTALVHAHYVKQLVAIDISDQMIEIAKQKAVDAGVENIRFQQGTLDDLAGEHGRFDAVLGLNVLHLLEDVDGAIETVAKLLKPQGVFVSSTAVLGDGNRVIRWLIPVMQFFGFAPHVSFFTKEQLIEKLNRAGFVIDKEWRSSREAVFIVARKIA